MSAQVSQTATPLPEARAAMPRRFAGFLRERVSGGVVGGLLLLLIAGGCFGTLPWSLERYETPDLGVTDAELPPRSPSVAEPMGSDGLGRSLVWRVLLGGAVSLAVGLAAAGLAVTIGVAWGLIAGYAGGRVDAAMMRVVDVIYGLPAILLVVMLGLALEAPLLAVCRSFLDESAARQAAGAATLWIAIGAVSWLTMSRVIRGQVLSLREQPFVEAARAIGLSPGRIMLRHLLPNLAAPIVVYATLTVPMAILQESTLSFLGIGIKLPLPSWGNLAAKGVEELNPIGGMNWWLLLFPCLALGLTLLSLNFMGEALRKRLDPRHRERR
jgi:oligopeptide transport system permease protein